VGETVASGAPAAAGPVLGDSSAASLAITEYFPDCVREANQNPDDRPVPVNIDCRHK
jgi:hypothetical protein